MLIHDACQKTGITKKAIEYYTEQGLIFPIALENGYKDYSIDDVERLKKIGLLRRLNLTVQEIKLAIDDVGGSTLQRICAQRVLQLKSQQKKQELLAKLVSGGYDADITQDLKTLDNQATIAKRLMDAFPGYFGCYFSLHFSRFLDSPIQTAEQEQAYQQIIAFLDDVPLFALSSEAQKLLEDSTNSLSGEEICSQSEAMEKAAEDFEAYYMQHNDAIDTYMEFKQTPAFKQSAAAQMQNAWKSFLHTSGYYTIFLPAMKQLSPAYAQYVNKLEAANDEMLSIHPEWRGLENIADE